MSSAVSSHSYHDMLEAGYCTTDGWLVWLRRIDNSIRFNKTWEEYERGFGYPGGNLWLGLEKLYKQKHVQVIDGY